MARFTSRFVLIVVSSSVSIGLASCESARIDPAELDYYSNAAIVREEARPTSAQPSWNGGIDDATGASGSPFESYPVEPAPAPRVHRLQSGDSIYGLSLRYLGAGKRWREIAELNGLSDAQVRRLAIGREIKIPAR